MSIRFGDCSAVAGVLSDKSLLFFEEGIGFRNDPQSLEAQIIALNDVDESVVGSDAITGDQDDLELFDKGGQNSFPNISAIHNNDDVSGVLINSTSQVDAIISVNDDEQFLNLHKELTPIVTVQVGTK